MSEALEIQRPMRSDARRNRERIIAAARELFASDQPDVQVDDVARRAGVGVGTLYRHFPDKEALMGELVRERFELFNERLRLALADESDDAFDALAAALRDNAASVADDAATRFAFLAGGERVFAHAAPQVEEFLALTRELVGRAHASGQLRLDFVAEDVPMVMCGVCATSAKRAAGWDWRRQLDLILDGMRSAGGPQPARRP
jgi:AcrR family transcriptional regulator